MTRWRGWFVATLLATLTIVVMARDAGAASQASEALKGRIEAAMDRWPYNFYQRSGPVVVREEGDAFAITIPGVALSAPDGGGLDIGDVAILARPLGDDRFDVSIALPKTMAIEDKAGTIVGFVVIERQRFKGVFVPSLKSLIETEASYGNIWFTRPGARPSARLATLEMHARLDEVASGRWSGPSTVIARDFAVDSDDAGRLVIDEIRIVTKVAKMRLAEMARFMDKSPASAAGGGAPAQWSDPAAALSFFGDMPSFYDGMSMDVSVSGIAADDSEGARAFTLDRAFYKLSLDDLDQALARFSFRYEHSGLAVTDAGELGEDFVPERAVLDFGAINVPAEDLKRSFLKLADPKMRANPDLAQAMLANQMSAAALKAKTELRVRAINVEAPALGMTTEGMIKGDPGAAMSATGWLEVVIRGLDAAIEKLATMPDRQTAAQSQGMAQFIAGLGVIDSDENGAKVRRYRFELTPEGKLLLNGTDFKQLLGAMMAPKQ